MNEFWETPQKKKLNKKKLAVLIIILILLISIIIIAIIYNNNKQFKNWMDKNIFNKEVMQANTNTIELENENSKICAFNKKIGVLNKNQFKIYNEFGNEETNLNIEITNPIFKTSNRFIAIAENGGQKLYIIEDKKIAWETSIEGNISQIHINKNGYVAVVITGTSYKSVIAMYDNSGNNLFNKYLSSTRLTDVSISNDNKYLALAEIDTSGTVVQSNVKIISIEQTKNDSSDSSQKTYQGPSGSLITNIKYQDKDRLICMYDDSIHLIANDKDEELINNDNKKITFSSIQLNNNIVNIEEKSSGLFTADSIVNITNIDNKSQKTYMVEGVTKEIYTFENIIALNLGVEVEFINTNGDLVKRYIANQEITNMVVSNSIAGIIYRDRIEIINL